MASSPRTASQVPPKNEPEGLERESPLRVPTEPTSRIGEILLRGKIIDREQLNRALERQKKIGGGRLGEHLIALGFLTDEILTQQLAKQFGIPIIDPSQNDVPADVLALVPSALVRKHMILPLSLTGSTLTISMADPSNYLAINEVKFLTGYDLRVTVAPGKSLQKAIDRLFAANNAYSQALSKLSSSQFQVMKEHELVDLQELERASEDAPVITLVNAIFAEAVKRRASDVHIEPYEKIFRVRLRIEDSGYKRPGLRNERHGGARPFRRAHGFAVGLRVAVGSRRGRPSSRERALRGKGAHPGG